MCGIFGVMYKDATNRPNPDLVAQSCRLLSHRGPDGHHSFVDAGVALAHTRLALVDLDPRSDQPFWDPTGRFTLVYNGEIYNYRVLRERLEEQGVTFRTTSDTEVLLQYLIRYGKAALGMLEGMFAFALYDRQLQSLLIARDRYGIKPLFCYVGHGVFMFASEVKSFRPWVALKPDMLSISSYLQGFAGPTIRQTFYQDIVALENGTYWTVSRSGIEQGRFWNMGQFVSSELRSELEGDRPAEIVDRLEELLVQSVTAHLISDAPVGALCSGGLDSSVLLAIAAKEHRDLSLFHADVKGAHSEAGAAQALARHLNLDLRVVTVLDHDFVEKMAAVTYHYEQPFIYHPNSVPFEMVAALVREHGVKAVLTGEGADECFLGYAHLPTENLFNSYRRVARSVRDAVQNIPFIGRHLRIDPHQAPPVVMDLHSRFERELDIEPSIRNEIAGNDRKTLAYLGHHLRTLLHRNDTLGMAASIEARFPYLYSELVRFAVNLPYHYKIRASLDGARDLRHPFMVSKWALREVAKRYLPKNLSQRPKRGFPTNALERMRISGAYFADSFVKDLFGLSDMALSRLQAESDHELKMRLLHLDVWGRLCLRNEGVATTTTRISRHVSFSRHAA